MIRIGMLSFWHVHGKDYARAAEEHPDTQITAVWDELPERGRAEAERRGVPFCERLDELLARPDVDAVVVTTPTVMHRDVMVAAARAGKHIFTEKLIAATLREAEEIVAAAAQAAVALIVSLRRVTDASTQAIRQVLDAGLLGDVTLLRVRDSHSGAVPTPERPGGWLVEHFFDRAQAQGGALTDLCHPVYLARHLLGMPEQLTATLTSFTGRAVEDNAVVTLRYPSGAIGVVETSFVARYSPFSVEVHGTEGSLLYSEAGIGELIDRFRAREAGAEPPAPGLFGADGKLRLRSTRHPDASRQWLVTDVSAPAEPPAFDQWVRHIQHGTRGDENIRLGLDLTALVEAANRSHETGRAVRLGEPG